MCHICSIDTADFFAVGGECQKAQVVRTYIFQRAGTTESRVQLVVSVPASSSGTRKSSLCHRASSTEFYSNHIATIIFYSNKHTRSRP